VPNGGDGGGVGDIGKFVVSCGEVGGVAGEPRCGPGE
jgi:hypothetical protein